MPRASSLHCPIQPFSYPAIHWKPASAGRLVLSAFAYRDLSHYKRLQLIHSTSTHPFTHAYCIRELPYISIHLQILVHETMRLNFSPTTFNIHNFNLSWNPTLGRKRSHSMIVYWRITTWIFKAMKPQLIRQQPRERHNDFLARWLHESSTRAWWARTNQLPALWSYLHRRLYGTPSEMTFV